MLFAYPRDFREQYRASMHEHLEFEAADWRSAGRTAADILSTAFVMRVENSWRDLTYAVRMNVRAPLFTAVIVAAIALSIAANAVVFALLDAVLLKPLPFANAGGVGLLWQQPEHRSTQVFSTLGTQQVEGIANASTAFSSVTATMSQDTVSGSSGSLERTQVLSNYFRTLGVHPALGSFFTRSSSDNAAVISYPLWRSTYGGNAGALGKVLMLDRKAYTIVGVAPAGMLDPSYGNLAHSDVWTQIPKAQAGDNEFAVFPIVRLKDGVTWQAAQADLARVQRNLKGGAAPFPGSAFFIGPLSDAIFTGARSFLWMVFAAVTGVLLIACANVANLLLVRGAKREGEFAVRSAVGASSRRIASQVFIEALLLAAAGAGIGLALAWGVLPWARASIPGDFPRLQTAQIDVRVLLYVCALLLGVTLLTGMIPAYKPRQKKRQRDPGARLRALLVVVEVALAFALTTGFGLLLHSFVSMTSVPLGFSPQNVYAASVVPNHNELLTMRGSMPKAVSVNAILRRIRAVPGVEQVAVSTGIPFENSFEMTFLLPSGWNGEPHTPPTPIAAAQVGASYFALMGIPLIAGRPFATADFQGTTSNIMVNQAFVRAYFPNGSAVGKTMLVQAKQRWRIAGVVADTRSSLKQLAVPQMYLPFNAGFGPYYGFAIRVAKPVPSLALQISAILRRTQPGSGAVFVRSMDDLIAADAAGTRTSVDCWARSPRLRSCSGFAESTAS